MNDKLDTLITILNGSKEYSFDYGEYGMSVLILRNYNTGETVRLDLGKLVEEYPDIVDDLIIEDNWIK